MTEKADVWTSKPAWLFFFCGT